MPQLVFGHKQWKRFEGNYSSQFRIFLGGKLILSQLKLILSVFKLSSLILSSFILSPLILSLFTLSITKLSRYALSIPKSKNNENDCTSFFIGKLNRSVASFGFDGFQWWAQSKDSVKPRFYHTLLWTYNTEQWRIMMEPIMQLRQIVIVDQFAPLRFGLVDKNGHQQRRPQYYFW